MSKTIKYVVVVHGMGQARQNETILAVASRFAEARSGQIPWPPPPIVVPLGSATGQTGICRDVSGTSDGLPWVEFQEIPSSANEPVTGAFFAQPSTSGDNLRFVDIHWNDLLTDDWDFVGQPPNTWVDGLLGRLIRKDGHPERVPQWILEILRTVGETVSLTHLIATLKAKDLDDLVFNKYLGDVQLYGEFPETRGRAVRRFHERMHGVMKKHNEVNPDDAAEFTVIAHSLGTIMAADSLLLARIGLDDFARGSNPALKDVLGGFLQGYFGREKSTDEDEIVEARWMDSVKSFVTLGSPIDKYLIIWWLNYGYMGNGNLIRWGENRIPHFNYCEEQDPVGDHLDVAYTAPAFMKMFEECEDRVYLRYAVPLLAHIHYWDDLPLFRWILAQTVDRGAPANHQVREPVWFVHSVYWWAVSTTYLILPLVVAGANFIALNWAWNADGANGLVLGGVTFSATWLLGRYLLDLFIWWRQVLKLKAKVAEGSAIASATGKSQEGKLAAAARGQLVLSPQSMPGDMLAATKSAVELKPVKSLVDWLAPDSETIGQPQQPDHRRRWISEQSQRDGVESEFRGLLGFIHGFALLVLVFAAAVYFKDFAMWRDLFRGLALLGSVTAVVGGWIIAVQFDIAGWKTNLGRNRFKVFGGDRGRVARWFDRIRREKRGNLPDTGRLTIEGFLDCDLPGLGLMVAAVIVGIFLAKILPERGFSSALIRYPSAVSAVLWGAAALSGAVGYTRVRIYRVRKLLSEDANQKPIDFMKYFRGANSDQ